MLGGSNIIREVNSKLFVIYRKFVLYFMILMLLWGVVTLYLSLNSGSDFTEVIHSSLYLLISIVNVINEQVRRDNINFVYKSFREIFPTFNKHSLIDEQISIRQKALKTIHNYVNTFCWAQASICCFYEIFVPIKNNYFPSLRGRYSETGVDSRLPSPIYLPKDDPILYYIAYALFCYILFFFYVQVSTIQEVYISILFQLRAEILLLNLSISKIDQRALINMKMKKNKEIINIDEISDSLPYQNLEFQECIFECVREDVRHHLEISRCIETLSSYFGVTLLEYSILSPVLFSLAGYFIVKRGIPEDKIFVFIFIIGIGFVFISNCCLLNEKMIDAIDETSAAIYAAPWYNYNKKVTKTLHIFLTNTMRPVMFRTAIFGIAANCELLLSIVSNAYSYINIVRNMK